MEKLNKLIKRRDDLKEQIQSTTDELERVLNEKYVELIKKHGVVRNGFFELNVDKIPISFTYLDWLSRPSRILVGRLSVPVERTMLHEGSFPTTHYVTCALVGKKVFVAEEDTVLVDSVCEVMCSEGRTGTQECGRQLYFKESYDLDERIEFFDKLQKSLV